MLIAKNERLGRMQRVRSCGRTRIAIVGALAAALAAALLLSGCGSDGPPEQVREELPTLSGTATYDITVSATEVSAKGVTGSPRTASNSTGTNQYNVSLVSLASPYILRWNGGNKRSQGVLLYSLATKAGTANITPLTTLMVAQLLGQDPAAAYAAFGASGGPRTELVTDAHLTETQAKLTAYLQEELGVAVKSGTASFVTAPFTATPGDPMFDTLQALDDKLVASGMTFEALTAQVAAEAALCIREKIVINVGGRQREFCPATKTANPEEADSTILDYVFMNTANDTLTIKVRRDEVLSGEYLTAAGASYTCTGAACGGIALGTPAADLTRTLTFTNTDLPGDTTRALLNGTLLGPVPGIALPVLPCDNNKYYVILADRTFIGDCVDALDPLGLGGTLLNARGAEPSRAVYSFSNSSSTDPAQPRVEVVMDANESLLSVYFTQVDPDTQRVNLRHVCQASACNGVTLGPVTVDTDILGPDFPISVRDITFDNTVLAGLNEDGSPTNVSATLKASFRTVYFVDPSSRMLFPDLIACMPGVDAVSMTAPSGPFNHCTAPEDRTASVSDDGDIVLRMTEDGTFFPLTVTVRGNVVTQVRYSNGQIFASYSCSSDCTGVIVSAPDADGNRTVTFDGTVLHEEQSFPLPGPRTLTLSSGALVFPPV